MGYTHYWRHTTSFNDAQWTRIVNAYTDLLKAAHHKGLPLSIGPDTNIAMSNHAFLAERSKLLDNHEEPIFFNGVGDGAHETVVLHKEAVEDPFEFCKTAMKPYDAMVTAFLSAVGSWYPDHISISSDGEEDDWQAGVSFARATLDDTITVPISVVDGDEYD